MHDAVRPPTPDCHSQPLHHAIYGAPSSTGSRLHSCLLRISGYVWLGDIICMSTYLTGATGVVFTAFFVTMLSLVPRVLPVLDYIHACYISLTLFDGVHIICMSAWLWQWVISGLHSILFSTFCLWQHVFCRFEIRFMFVKYPLLSYILGHIM